MSRRAWGDNNTHTRVREGTAPRWQRPSPCMSAATAPARDTHMLPSPSAEAPAPPAAQAPTAADADAVNAQGTPFPAGLKVLLVDDDPTCLKVVESMLRR